MTMSVTVVNTSNWTDEVVEVYLSGFEMYSLKPGESAEIGVEPGRLKSLDVVAKRDAERSKPHMVDGVQVFPKVRVDWES